MKHMVELVIVGEKDDKILKMKTDDGRMVLEHKVGKEDKLKWLSTNQWYWSVFSLLELNFLAYIALYAVDVIQYTTVQYSIPLWLSGQGMVWVSFDLL